MAAILTLRARLGRVFVAVLLAAGLASVVPVTHADAAVSASVGVRAVSVARHYQGVPYKWGAVGPRAFDCSGYVQYVYRQLGKKLPRTSATQYRATMHIRKSQIRVGDLVFFVRSGRVYHVGIYAGGNRIWHAPHTGSHVKLERIWTTSWVAGRVR